MVIPNTEGDTFSYHKSIHTITSVNIPFTKFHNKSRVTTDFQRPLTKFKNYSHYYYSQNIIPKSVYDICEIPFRYLVSPEAMPFSWHSSLLTEVTPLSFFSFLALSPVPVALPPLLLLVNSFPRASGEFLASLASQPFPDFSTPSSCIYPFPWVLVGFSP
jgi:hypothetical protein